jgi:hypothetical protein
MAPDTAAPPVDGWSRQMAGMLAGFVWLAAASYGRLWWSGSPGLESPPLPLRGDIVLHLLMAPGLASLCAAALELWRHPPPYEARRQVLGWALVLAAAAAIALPLTSNDIFSNLAYGHMTHVGLDTSRLGPQALPVADPFRALVAPRWLDSPCVYGPVSRAAFALTTTTGSVWSSLLAYKLLFLLLTWLAIVVCYHGCGRTLPRAQVPAALVLLAVNPLLLWEMAGQGHNDGLMVLFTLLFVVLLRDGRSWMAAACLVVAVLAKSAVLPVFFFLAVSRLPRFRARYYGLACGAGLVAAVAVAWVFPDLLLSVGAPVSGYDVSKRLINSVPDLVYRAARLFSAGTASTAYRVYWAASLAFVAALVIRLGRRTTGPQAVVESSLRALLALVLAFSPNLQPWYFIWMLPFAVYSTSEPLRRFVVSASAAFLMLYAAPFNVPTWTLAVLSLVAFVLVLRDDPVTAWHVAPTGAAPLPASD